MNILNLRRPWLAAVTLLCVLVAPWASAQQTIDTNTLDKWLATTQDFIPMQSVLDAIGKESKLTQEYSEDEFNALSIARQNEVMDELLKEKGVYDEVYSVLNQHDWSAAGDYMRTGSRLGKAIAVHMQQQMLASLPAEQAQMMKEMTGGDIEAGAADVKLVSDNWPKIQAFMTKNMDAGKMPVR